jgi:hypothetical protein
MANYQQIPEREECIYPHGQGAHTVTTTTAVERTALLTPDEVEAIGYAADLLELKGEDIFERGVKDRQSAQIAEEYIRWGGLCRAVHVRAGGDNRPASDA